MGYPVFLLKGNGNEIVCGSNGFGGHFDFGICAAILGGSDYDPSFGTCTASSEAFVGACAGAS
jgi:hypothetical protein